MHFEISVIDSWVDFMSPQNEINQHYRDMYMWFYIDHYDSKLTVTLDSIVKLNKEIDALVNFKSSKIVRINITETLVDDIVSSHFNCIMTVTSEIYYEFIVIDSWANFKSQQNITCRFCRDLDWWVYTVTLWLQGDSLIWDFIMKSLR